MHRYVVFVWDPRDVESARSIQSVESQLLLPTSPWSIVYRDLGVLVAQRGARRGMAEAYPLANRSGVVVGCLFSRREKEHFAREEIRFGDNETQQLLETRGQHLIDAYWGRYVMILRDTVRGEVHILRDPTALMKCFHTITPERVNVFFSDIEDCVDCLHPKFSINWKYMTARVLIGQILNRETGLREVEDIPGGERQTLSRGGISRAALWNPEQFGRCKPLEDVRIAGRELRAAAQTVVSAWASCHASVVHSLSGGLDSSIVAGLLANAPSKPAITGFNYFIEPNSSDKALVVPGMSERYLAKLRRLAGHPDERKFARLIAAHHGFPLIEFERRVDRIDISTAFRAPMSVVPSEYMNIPDLDDEEVRVVKSCNATAFFSGLGGDSVLYCSSHCLGAADYVYAHGFDAQAMKELHNATAVSRDSLWHVLGTAIKHGLLRRPLRPTYDRVHRPSLLTDTVLAAFSPQYIEHPWDAVGKGFAPGKREHIVGMSGALFYHHAYARERAAVSAMPLISQPVVELCLRIPIYTLLAGGVSRGLARNSFADLLPREIYKRTTKGTGSAAQQQFIKANMPLIRDTLLNGILVHEGILDRTKVEGYLTPEQQFTTVLAGQVSDYFLVEGWLQQWSPSMQQRVAA